MDSETRIHEFRPLLNWFQSNGGYVDLSSMDLTTFPSSAGGRGAVAVKNIPVRLNYIQQKSSLSSSSSEKYCTGRTCTVHDTPRPNTIDAYIFIAIAIWIGTMEDYEDG
jgi:hypothetical protein